MAATAGYLGVKFLRSDGTTYEIGTLADGQFLLVDGSNIITGSMDLSEFRGGFGRLATAQPLNLWNATHVYAQNNKDYQYLTSGTASVAHDLVNSLVTLTAPSSSRAVLQSRQYVPYQPGKLLQWFFTGILGAVASGSGSVRYGVFDERADKSVTASSFDDTGNGHFFQVTSSGASVVERKMVSGVQTDTVIAQAAWNGDPLDGTGASGFTLDTTKAQIFLIQKEWLGVGEVQMGVVVQGVPVICHTFFHTNELADGPYNTSGALPLRMEVDATTSLITLSAKQICASATSIGGFEQNAVLRRATVAGFNPTSTPTAHLGVRLSENYNRVSLYPRGLSYTAAGWSTSEIILVEVYVGATHSGTPVWTVSGESPAMEISTTSGTLTGGVKIFDAFMSQSQPDVEFEVNTQSRPLVANIDGSSQEFWFVVSEFAGGVGSSVLTVRFNENR